MRKQFIIINILAVTFAFSSNAQSTIDSVLESIARNNKSIQASEKFWEAKKFGYKTGNALYGPAIEYDYLWDSPDAMGNQTEVQIVQAFDFPSTYVKRKQLANEQIMQTKFQQVSVKQEILFEAKVMCIELVYFNKLNNQLEQRKRNFEKILSSFQTKMEKGEGNILDVNKAKLQLIDIKKRYNENVFSIKERIIKLTGLNGGSVVIFNDTIYPDLEFVQAFEQLEQNVEENDPHKKILEQEINIVQKQLEVRKSLRLPTFEAGFRYIGSEGQKYNGVHTGISLPLWASKNSVKQQKANLLYTDLELQVHLNEHYHQIKTLYDKYENLKRTLEEYQKTFTTLNNESLLNKAYSVGHISTIEYFMEMNYYNNAFNNFLKVEMEYNAVIAALNKYQL